MVDNGVFKPTTVGTPQREGSSLPCWRISLWTPWSRCWNAMACASCAVPTTSSSCVATTPRPKRRWLWVRSHLENELKLKSSPEKTHIAAFSEGFEYLGFNPSSRSMTMREKSVENFKTKIREITKRSFNLDDSLIIRVNQIARGAANYFATAFSHNRSLFRKFDRWIRMRLRYMKYKRKWKTDNRRFRLKYFRRMGLLSMQDFYPQPA